ncbi:MAG: hypothetical protein GY725_13175 [bacterium]|nr:hypothetical protein [bacterium]
MAEDRVFAVAIVGGATAGAEAADIFAGHGILTVVFEQNPRPYGKVEDGLPRWHVGLRRKEYDSIDRKLNQEDIRFVPLTALSRDVSLPELANEWGFHAVVLAHGAWRDRPLPIEGADEFVRKGLVYQNPFILWFNHRHEKNFAGEVFEALNDTIVVGGGLASIDVAKALNLELTLAALRERGIEEDLVELEVKGIPRVLESHDLTWKELGIQPATIFYRRRPEDMPLVNMPDGADDKMREKIEKSRARVLAKSQEKYLFEIEPLRAPVDLIVENERLTGLVFARTRLEAGRVLISDETVEVRGSQIISSIGSIPEEIADIPMKGELYAYEDWDLGRLPGFPTVFSAGNVVTGKGNIVDSRKHARRIGTHVSEQYLRIADEVKKLKPLAEAERNSLLARVRERQEKIGYKDYTSWIEASCPPEFI